MAPRRPRLRPPGVKPWTRIGTLGPFRGRLGLSWVVAPLVLGLVLLGAGWFLLLRPHAPGGSFEPVGRLSSFAPGSARAVDLPGVFISRVGNTVYAVLQEGGCAIVFCRGRFVDCRGAVYGLDGRASGDTGLERYPVDVYAGEVYVDPDHPIVVSPAPVPATPARSCP